MSSAALKQIPHVVDDRTVSGSEWSWLMVEMADRLSGTAMLLGHAIRMHADAGRGDSAFPTVATLAGMIGKSRSVVHRALKELQEAGLIEGYDSAPSGAVVYRLVRPRGVTSRRRHLAVVETEPVESTTQGGVSSTTQGGVSSTTHNQASNQGNEEEARGEPDEHRMDAEWLVWQAADRLGASPRDLAGRDGDDVVDAVARLLRSGVGHMVVYGSLTAAAPPSRVRSWGALMIARLKPLGAVGRNPTTLDTAG